LLLRKIQDYYSIVTVKSSGDIFAQPVRVQKIGDYAVTDLHLRKDSPSLSSGAAPLVEELQAKSSKNTIDEMVDAVTSGNAIGLRPAIMPGKMREYWLKMKQVLSHTAMKNYF